MVSNIYAQNQSVNQAPNKNQTQDQEKDFFPKRDIKGNLSQNFTSQSALFTVSSYKTRYSAGEDIALFLRIKNQGIYPITLYMHQNYLRNFTIVTRDSKGRSLAMKDIFYREKNHSKQRFFFEDYTGTLYKSRAIILQPNEVLERQLDLHEIVEIKKESKDIEKFQIQGYFYPNPEQNPDVFIKSSNDHTIFVDSEQIFKQENYMQFGYAQQYDSGHVLLTPKEVVYLALSAEYANDWDNFFKYLSIPDIIKDYPEYAKHYMSTSGVKRVTVLDSFRNYLRDQDSHRLLKFHLIQSKKNKYLTKRSDQTAQVQVEASREVDGFRRKFRYTYYLTRKRPLWRITGIESQLLE